jgi:hypothetical protein
MHFVVWLNLQAFEVFSLESSGTGLSSKGVLRLLPNTLQESKLILIM